MGPCLVLDNGGRLVLTGFSFDYDVAVLGAGAAGLMAAARAAESGARVALFEKNRRAGVKILMSGGTRCNLTNARGLRRLDVVSGPIDPTYDSSQNRGIRSIQQGFGANGAFLGPALKRLDVDATVRLFEDAGLATKVEGNGKIFPASDRAIDVLDVLLRRLEHSGAILLSSCPVREIERVEETRGEGNGFALRLTDSKVTARRVIVAVGGRSYPGCGTTGDGYAIARQFGHTIVDPRPALVPIRVGAEWVADMKGISLSDVVASIHSADHVMLQERREAVLFAHFGLSGPAILDVSRSVARSDGVELLSLHLDLYPESSREELDRALQVACRQGRRPLVSLMPDLFPRRLAESLVSAAGIPLQRNGPDLSRDERHRLVSAIKELSLPVIGTLGFEKAEVTSGGVSLDEVDSKTLESRLTPGLHFAGEVLDLDGLIGGYNFQAAWSLGWLAGESAAEKALA